MNANILMLLREANRAYPDNIIADYFNLHTGKEQRAYGDTLAQFIGREIIGVLDGTDYNEQQARDRVIRALETAAEEIYSVIHKIQKGV